MDIRKITAKRYFLNSLISQSHLIILLIVSVVLRILSGLFSIPGVADGPQFTNDLDPSWIKGIIHGDPIYIIAYYGYFILDYIWAFLLIWTIWKFVQGNLINKESEIFLEDTSTTIFKLRKEIPAYKMVLFVVFTVACILAYVFDGIENWAYVFHHTYNESAATLKLGAYAVIAIALLLSTANYFIETGFELGITFIKSASYSLIILLLIGIYLPQAPQVNSIVVNLYEQPWSMVILLVMVSPLFAVALAHYPSYFNIREDHRDWIMGEQRFLLFGVVSYKYNEKYKNETEDQLESSVNFLLRILGIMFYTALFYLMAYTSEVNFNWKINTASLAFAILAFGILWLYLLRLKKLRWYDATYEYILSRFPKLYDGDYSVNGKKFREQPKQKMKQSLDMEEQRKILFKINPLVRRGAIFFFLAVILHLILFALILFSEEAYTQWTAILTLLCIVSQMAAFVYYRTLRSLLKFTFYNEHSTATKNAFSEAHKPLLPGFFKDFNFRNQSTFFDILARLRAGGLSNNVLFLKLFTAIGYFNLLFFIAINVVEGWAFYFNPILIILSALYIYYGVLIVITKNYIYYKYSKDPSDRIKFNFKFGLLIVGLLLLVLNRLGRIPELSNELFTLNPVPRNMTESDKDPKPKDEIDLSTYVANLSKNDTRYYIGCYGGGMKSNAWTMTVLNNLYKKDNELFNKTVGLSGVSGGTMGLINMSAIAHNNEASTWEDRIEDISTEHILSLDLTHILGRDTFTHMFLPKYNRSGMDRSTKAMKQYAELSGNDRIFQNKTPYRTFWKEIYEENNNHFPILISNTTNVTGNQGMAVSVNTDSISTNLLYHGANDILDIHIRDAEDPKKRNPMTLDYYDAASTSNRFPLISPAAKIETKGHFNDGGIYENSGMLSVYKLFKAVNELEGLSEYGCLQQRNVFINIVNDKVQYIKHKVTQRFKYEIDEINGNTEINAIISSVASTEMLPIFIKTELDKLDKDFDNIEFRTIYLPHKFTVADVKKIYGKKLIAFTKSGDRNEKTTYKNLFDLAHNNNRTIDTMIRKDKYDPVIQPPMSRVITKEAYQFMVEMLKHEVTAAAVSDIVRN